MFQITMELSRLHKLALDNKLSPEDISGGTITLSNIGSIGGKFGSPLLNVPEVSIIAIGRIQKVPQMAAADGTVFQASVMNVSIIYCYFFEYNYSISVKRGSRLLLSCLMAKGKQILGLKMINFSA